MKRVRNTPRQSEKGVVAVECAIIFPLLALLLIGTFEFGLIVRDHQLLQNASREGAYFATLPKNNRNAMTAAELAALEVSIEDVVLDYLANEGITAVTRPEITVDWNYTFDSGRIPGTEVVITHDRNLVFRLFSFLGNPLTISAGSAFANLF